MPAPTAQFLQAGCPSCRPTNSVKALKAVSIHINNNNNTCVDIVVSGRSIKWEMSTSNLGIYLESFKCSVSKKYEAGFLKFF